MSSAYGFKAKASGMALVIVLQASSAGAQQVAAPPPTSEQAQADTRAPAGAPPAIRPMTVAEKTEYDGWLAAANAASSAQDWVRAEALWHQILTLELATLGPEHPAVAVTNSALAQSYNARAQFAQAEPLYRRAMAIRQKVMGSENLITANSQIDLAYNLQVQGKAKEAEPLLREALQTYEKMLGTENMSIATNLIGLAYNLQAQNRAIDAEPFLSRALAISEKMLGNDHIDTAAVLNALASNLDTQGREVEAEPIHRRALAIREKQEGSNQLDTAQGIRGLASNLEAQGKASEAEPLHRRALAIYEDALGPEHSDTAQSLYGLAFNLYLQGRTREAELLYRRALAIFEHVFPPEHLVTADCLYGLAIDLDFQGRGAEAEPLHRRALAIREDLLGAEDIGTATSLYGLALNVQGQGRVVEAEPIYRRALLIYEKAYGPVHQHIATSLNGLGNNLRLQGRGDEALVIYRRALAIREAVLGPKHSDYATSLYNVASILESKGNEVEAEDLYRRALAIAQEVRGIEHPWTATNMLGLATNLRLQGRTLEADSLYGRASDINIRELGLQHPDTISGMHNHAYNRLINPQLEAEALPLTRLVLTGSKSRYAEAGDSGVRGELQQKRDRASLQATERLFADAAWVRGAAFPSEAPGLRMKSFGALQGAGSGPAARAIAETAARRYAVEAGAGELVSERARQVERWAAAERRNIAAQAQSGVQDRAAREAMERDMAAAEARIQAIDAELKVKAPQYFAIVNQPPLDVAEAQGLLGDDEAVLIVVPSEFGTHVMALTKTELVWHRADIKAGEVAEKVTALRRDLNPGEGARGPDAELAYRPSFDRATAHDLYAKLIAPVAATLEGKSHLFIAADGALASLPFGVLVTEAPQAGSDDSDPDVLRATPWFADAHALVQIPSLQSLAYLRRFNTGEGEAAGSSPARSTAGSAVPAPATSPRAATVRTAASGFAGFGDPVLSGAAVKRGGRSAGTLPPVDASGLTGRGVTEAGAPLMNPEELRALARLPGTRTELEAVGKLLGAPAGAIRLDASMTEAALRSADLSNVRILHLATHGLTASEAGQRGARTEPGLVFTPPAEATSQDDGYLAASEVLTLNLTAVDWVILSACNTAAPSGTPGEPGLSGLARAFFYAGAPSLLVSHWPVGDDVAAALTVNTLRRTQAGETRATALQNAMRDIRNDPNNPSFAHPSAWAPFTIAGEGR